MRGGSPGCVRVHDDERGGSRGGWFSVLMYICIGKFSQSYVNDTFYSVNLILAFTWMYIVVCIEIE